MSASIEKALPVKNKGLESTWKGKEAEYGLICFYVFKVFF
jgi:hypothetical protein